ncbi:MAG TPA: precorrin-6Y C5,15-methyltransferase (decarboxylating) subunit CbiT, partial [Reyranellaceae bacterium]|nr:precorrin-6Y C5,15-methyltransferase (decarboxylating) subunit CbiT [Reyranellaceae bacterium]
GATPAKLARLLVARGMGRSRLIVLEHLAGANERVRETMAAAFALDAVDALNIVAVEIVADAGARIVPLASGLDDTLFEHDGQLTKREIRAVTLSALAPRQGELLWDVGLGAGSIAIEWLLRHQSLRAIGFEARPERAARAARNAATLGTPDLRIVEGRAPDSFKGQPAPDAIFVGGGLSNAGMFDAVWSVLKPGGRIAANAVTAQSHALLADAFKKHGGELTRLEVSRAERDGSWKQAYPIVQWRAVKP